jgi:Domain of unknown function (DUF1330)
LCRGVLGVEEYTMKTRYIVGLALLAGVAMGSTATHVLRAQAKPMGYVIAENVVKDQDAYGKEFAPAIAKSIQDAGGKFLARGGKRWEYTAPHRRRAS